MDSAVMQQHWHISRAVDRGADIGLGLVVRWRCIIETATRRGQVVEELLNARYRQDLVCTQPRTQQARLIPAVNHLGNNMTTTPVQTNMKTVVRQSTLSCPPQLDFAAVAAYAYAYAQAYA